MEDRQNRSFVHGKQEKTTASKEGALKRLVGWSIGV
jgi:hypothetical protein